MWNLPTPGIEPVSPALADRFLPTHHQGRPYMFTALKYAIQWFLVYSQSCSTIIRQSSEHLHYLPKEILYLVIVTAHFPLPWEPLI